MAKKAKKKSAKKTRKTTKRTKSRKSGKREGKKRPKRGFKLSATTRRKIGAKSRAHWRSITGNGRPGGKGGNHIPLKQLEKNHARLGRTIALRKKSPAAWA